jgi:CRISPR type I-A-associated protein Csa5
LLIKLHMFQLFEIFSKPVQKKYMGPDIGISMTQVEEPTRVYRDVAVLLSAASILTESPSLIDRMANCLSPEPAVRAVTDALRIVEGDQRSEKPRLRLEQDKEKKYPYVLIDDFPIFGRIPSGETVRRFIEEVYQDISTARKIGTFASSLVVEYRLRVEREQGGSEGE